MCAIRVKSKNNFAKGRRGLADVVRLSENNMRVDFYANEDMNLPAESFQVSVSFGEEGTVPEYFPFKKMKDGSKVMASVTMDEAGKRMLFSVPASGYFEAKFDKFITGEEDAPVMESKKGKKNTYRYFDCLFELTGGNWQNLQIKDGVWKGAKYWFRLYDNFAENESGGLAVAGSGDGSNNLSDFLDAVVGGGEQIPFSENPLPEIQKIAHEEDRRFNLNVAKGWVVSIVVPLDMDEEIGFLEEEEIPEALKED